VRARAPAAAILALAAACAPTPVPPHLRPPAPVSDTPPPANADALLAAWARADPLLRRPPGTDRLAPALPGAPWLATYLRLSGDPAAGAADWRAFAAAHPGTLAGPLAAGAALAAVEVALAVPAGEDAALPWLGPIAVDARVLPAAARGPLDWLAPADPSAIRATALHLAEGAVLRAWLSSGLALGPVAAALQPGVHDRLRSRPEGALILARAAGVRDPAAAVAGAAALARATSLALEEAAADRDSEQSAWARTRDAARAQTGAADPIGFHLDAAWAAYLLDAGEPRSAAAAHVAITAARVRGSCADRPCGGLDRMETLRRLEDAEPAAQIWRVIQWKSAVDTLEASHDRPSAWLGMPLLADALLGEGAGAIPHDLLRVRAFGPSAWLALSRAARGADATTFVDAARALRARVAGAADAAMAHASGQDAALLTRVAQRARQAPPTPSGDRGPP